MGLGALQCGKGQENEEVYGKARWTLRGMVPLPGESSLLNLLTTSL